MFRKTAWLALCPLLLFLAACDFEEVFADSNRFKEDFQFTHPLRAGGTVTLENFNGSVEILSWEKDQVQITGTKFARTEEDLRALKIETAAGPDSVRIRTVRPSDRHRGMGARYVLRVPRQVRLERVATSNGSVRVEDIEGDSRLESSNGSVTLRRIRGRLDVKTSNAGISASDLESEATLRTSNGSINIDQIAGALDANTSNAGIHVRVTKPAARRPLQLGTSNGSIELTMDAFSDNEIRASTSNASITVRVPPTARGQLRASTSNGNVQSELDVQTRTAGKSFLEGQLGAGGSSPITLSTSNASIRLLRL